MNIMKREIVFKKDDWKFLSEYLSQDKINETAIFGFAKISRSDNLFRFLVRDFLTPTNNDYQKRTGGFVSLKPEFVDLCYNICEENNLHLIDIHTHPFSNDVHFSPIDDKEDSQVKGPHMEKEVPGIEQVFMVHGANPEDLDARMWDRNSHSLKPINLVKVLSDVDLRLLMPKSAKYNVSINEAIHNRTMLVLGKEILKRYADTRIGLIGVGGIGSIIGSKLLTRSGFRNLIMIDPDHIDFSNLNRFPGATLLDAILKIPKTVVAARNIFNIDPQIKVKTINGDFLEKENQKLFKSCDIIIGCTDSVGVRLAINKLCLAHGIAYIDLGCGALVEDDKLKACGGQVIKIMPGSDYCMNCGDFFDMSDAHIEFTDPEEAARQRAMGYVEGDNVPEPSVYALNMMVASQAAWLVMRFVAGDKFDFDGIYIDAMTFETFPWSEKEKQKMKGENHCPACGKDGVTFGGDEIEPLVREEKQLTKVPLNKSPKKLDPSDDNIEKEGNDDVVQHQGNQREEQNNRSCQRSRPSRERGFFTMLKNTLQAGFKRATISKDQ